MQVLSSFKELFINFRIFFLRKFMPTHSLLLFWRDTCNRKYILEFSRIRDIPLDSGAFKTMSNFRLLKFYISEYDGVPIISSRVQLHWGLECLPIELRNLHWHKYLLKILTSDFELENLIGLSLSCSKVKQIWKREKV